MKDITMANSGIVKSVAGDVKVIAADETERILKVGERVFFNERIITGNTGVVTIKFSDGTNLGLGVNSNLVLDDVLNLDLEIKQTDPTDQMQGSVQDEVAAIQQALAEDQVFDPSKLEAPAAGGVQGAGDENTGHSIIGIDYLNPVRTPESGFDALGSNNQAIFLDIAQPELILEPVSAIDAVFPPPLAEAPIVLVTDHNDSELGENSAVEDSSIAVTGTFVLVAPEGLSSVTVGGQIILEADLLGIDASSINIVTDEGVLVIDGFDAETGVVNYSYLPDSGAKDHSDGDESIVDQIEIILTDNNNVASAPEMLDVLIVDTVPIAVDNVEILSQNRTVLIDNVITNARNEHDDAVDDFLGVDGSKLHSITFAGVTKEFLDPSDLIQIDGNDFIQFDAENGRLLIQENGQYGYTITDSEGVAEVSDTFEYQLIDGDGDLSTANLTVTQVLGDNINTGEELF
jgi:hypothetical protein